MKGRALEFRNRIYYRLKPLLPQRVRLAFRQVVAQRIRRISQETWPINPSAGRKPEGWTGWPEGKKFAFVLTHDVEGKRGLEKSRQLMAMEMSAGFRSSFNFVPEGSYQPSQSLREEMVREGFEVGVHDLRHDGMLFQSKRGFAERANRVNGYIKEWGAAGFRSAFMLRNLDWIHDLNIAYDASTFDTDPFEPQPEGVGSIFPFWVPAPGSAVNGSRRGYVELPYTLAQDSSLFILLRERSVKIWLEKLDWVAAHGGMVLVNVHPDYVRFPGEPASAWNYPAEFYLRLLEYVRERHGDSFWHALPREVSEHVARRVRPILHRKPRRICTLAYTFYESDARVARYCQALAARGDEVDAIVARNGARQSEKVEWLDGVRVLRIQTRQGNEKSKLSYLFPLLRFLLEASRLIARRHKGRGYDLLHIHNVPDFLVVAGLWPKLRGAKIILDIHDIVPEFFVSKFGVGERSTVVRLLKWMEKMCAAIADHVIISNHLWLEKYTARSAPAGKCSVWINYVDRRVFSPRPRTRTDDRLILLFPGSLQWHQGLDIAIRAVNRLKEELPRLELHIYGEGSAKLDLVRLTRELQLESRVRFFERVSLDQIAEVMANADLGVVPKRANSFGDEAYSTKILEFMSVGVPVVVSSTKIDRFYFKEEDVRFFESGNDRDLAAAVREVLEDPALRGRLAARGAEYVKANNWESKRDQYLGLVDRLEGGKEALGMAEREAARGTPDGTADDGGCLGADFIRPSGSPAKTSQ